MTDTKFTPRAKSMLTPILNAWHWLKITFFLLGLASAIGLGLIGRYGLPSWLQSLDNKNLAAAIEDLQAGMAQMQETQTSLVVWSQEQQAKQNRLQVAKK